MIAKILNRSVRFLILYIIMFVVASYMVAIVSIIANSDKVCYLCFWPPAAIIYTDNVVSDIVRSLYPEEAKWADSAEATTSLVVIRIKKEHFGDECIIAHEMEHVRQYMRSLGTNGLMARLSDKYILEREIEAFRAQLKCMGNDDIYIQAAARALSENYGLGISYDEAYKRLSE